MKLFLEHYHKLAHIGRGANAHVYKVRHADLGYIRAVKVLNDYIEDEQDKTYRTFIKECRALLTIGNGCHPNIVRIYGPALIENHAVVEMDYVQGQTLDSYIREQKFVTYDEVQRFIHDIVGALAYTHHDIYQFLMDPNEDNLDLDPNDGRKFLISADKERQLVRKYGTSHNDLHSNNVMRRDYDGHFLLLDFGLSVQDGVCVRSSRMGDGAPEYMAPEKYDSETVSPRSDIYSIGVLLYEMLAGRVPFPLKVGAGGNVSQEAKHQVFSQHRSTKPEPILPLRRAAFEATHPGEKYERDYPEWLDDVIMKCLAKKPGDRYADAKALLTDIDSHTDTDKEPVPANQAELDELTQENEELRRKLDTANKDVKSLKEKNATLSKKANARTIENYLASDLSNRYENTMDWLEILTFLCGLIPMAVTVVTLLVTPESEHPVLAPLGILSFLVPGLFCMDCMWLEGKEEFWADALRLVFGIANIIISLIFVVKLRPYIHLWSLIALLPSCVWFCYFMLGFLKFRWRLFYDN